MSRNLLHRHALTQIPHQDKREKVREYIKQSALMLYEPYKSKKLYRKVNENECGSNTISDANSLASHLSEPASTDILDGERAVKKRLEDRKKRRKYLSEMRRSPQLHHRSSPSSSRRRHFDRKIAEKKARKGAKKIRTSHIQDRSIPKAERIRKESRSKEKEKSIRNKYLDLFQFNGAPPLKRERITIPQPKQGIFSRGTASPYTVNNPKVRNKKRKRSPSISTEDEDYESSMAASMARSASFESDKGNQTRIRALEKQIKELQKSIKLIHSPLQHKMQMDELDMEKQHPADTSPKPHQKMARVPGQSVQTQTNHTFVDVEHMPWSHKPAQNEPAESVIQDDPPVLAFNGDKPDMHPNGWRAQHRLHDPGLSAIQKQFVDAGGANFIPGEPTSAPQYGTERSKANEPQCKSGEVKQEYQDEQELYAEEPCRIDKLTTYKLPRATYESHGAEDDEEDYYDTYFHKFHFRDQFDLFNYEVPVNEYELERFVRLRPRQAFRHEATSLPDTTTEKVQYMNGFRRVPTYDYEKHLKRDESVDRPQSNPGAEFQQERMYNDYTERLNPQSHQDELNYDQALPKAEYQEEPLRQDVNTSDNFVQDKDEAFHRNTNDRTLYEMLRTNDVYTYGDSYEHEYADTIYSTEHSAPNEYPNYSKQQELNEEDFEGFWHPHRLI